MQVFYKSGWLFTPGKNDGVMGWEIDWNNNED